MEALAAPLQLADPTAVLDAPGLVRGLAAFGVVLVLGAGIRWRYAGMVDRAIDASAAKPLSSLGYGVAAHLTIVFFSFYAASQLAQLTFSGWSLAGVGVLAGVLILAAVAALGFTVVGTAALSTRWEVGPWHGLLAGAVAAGVIALAEPLLAAMLWVILVSTGIGGPVRRWFHAADDVQTPPG